MSNLVVVTPQFLCFKGSLSALPKVLFESNLGWRRVMTGDKVLEWWKTSGHAQDLTFISQAQLFGPYGFGAMTG